MRTAAVICGLCAALAAGVARGASGPFAGSVAARVIVSPLAVTVVVPSGPVNAGKDFRIRADVSNLGRTPLTNVAVSLAAPSALVLRDPATQATSRIGAGGSAKTTWDACTTSPGGYVVLARAIAGAFTAESLGQLVQVVKAKKKPSC